ncbi:hypothetical protein C8R43DRAFT_950276 [Mycena crocata]|nr:hypothetical protein C8R43DRAFT_950276 [Mycena crocata]
MTTIVASESHTGLGIAFKALVIYICHYQCPATHFRRLEDTIRATEKISERTKSECVTDHAELMDAGRRLIELLEARTKACQKNLQDVRGVIQDTESTEYHFQLSIEAERQRQMSEEIKQAREILNLVLSPTLPENLRPFKGGRGLQPVETVARAEARATSQLPCDASKSPATEAHASAGRSAQHRDGGEEESSDESGDCGYRGLWGEQSTVWGG